MRLLRNALVSIPPATKGIPPLVSLYDVVCWGVCSVIQASHEGIAQESFVYVCK